MHSRKEFLKKSKLYLILDAQVESHERLFEKAQKAICCGVDVIQLRDKNGSDEEFLASAERLQNLIRGKSLFVINDRVSVAQKVKPSGVHLGQEDFPLKEARQVLGPESIIGISCQTLAQAQEAEQEGADYIGFGSVFKTLTKPERAPMDLQLLMGVLEEIQIPVFPIGGINLENIEILRSIGVKRVAVCRALLESLDFEASVLGFKKRLSQDV